MLKSNDRTVLRLVDLLYSCVDGESSWSDFLNILAEQFDASVVGLTTVSVPFASAGDSIEVPRYQVHNVCVGIDAKELLYYEKNYMGINPWFGPGRTFADGKVLLTEEVLPFNVFRKTAYYNEWGKRNGVAHAIGAAIRATPNGALFLAVNRGDSQKPFDERHRASAQVLMPHLKRAANLQGRISAFEERGWILDSLSFPMIYVSSVGIVHWVNDAAENLLRRGRGLRLQQGRLRAQLATEDAHLRKMLSEERAVVVQRVDGHGGWLRITNLDDGSEMSLFLTRPPFRIRRSLGLLDGNSSFLIFVASQSIDANTLACRLRESWGLTVAEAALAFELLKTEGLLSAAEKLRVSRNTAKTQLSAIFQKAGVRKQSELVKKLLVMAAMR